jgi:hypothetical protein
VTTNVGMLEQKLVGFVSYSLAWGLFLYKQRGVIVAVFTHFGGTVPAVSFHSGIVWSMGGLSRTAMHGVGC